jgi:hypothetical protein
MVEEHLLTYHVNFERMVLANHVNHANQTNWKVAKRRKRSEKLKDVETRFAESGGRSRKKSGKSGKYGNRERLTQESRNVGEKIEGMVQIGRSKKMEQGLFKSSNIEK